MLSLFKSRANSTVELTADDMQKAVIRLGQLVDTFPRHIVDSALLPLPKPQMKAALKIFWSVATRDQRDALEVGFLSLANFQDGVGPTPVRIGSYNDDLDPEQRAWMEKSYAEMKLLNSEFQRMKRGGA